MSRITRIVGDLAELANEMDEAGYVTQANAVDHLARKIYAQVEEGGIDPAAIAEQQQQMMQQIEAEQQQAAGNMEQEMSEQERQMAEQQEYFDDIQQQMQQNQEALRAIEPPAGVFGLT